MDHTCRLYTQHEIPVLISHMYPDLNREMVVSTCERLRPIVYSQAVEEAADNEDERVAIAETINVGTSLFELYLSLQHMAS